VGNNSYALNDNKMNDGRMQSKAGAEYGSSINNSKADKKR
jgi:hypothetical protein